MRAAICGLSLIALAAAAAAPATQPGGMATTQPAIPKTCVMASGGTNVLQLTAPAGTKCVAADGSLKVGAPAYDAECWLVPGAKTVAEGVDHLGPQIVGEFTAFKAEQTTDLTIAGGPAKQLTGTGHEADDGDPGAAECLVFAVGGHVFVACTHGETLNAAAKDGLLALAKTARVP